DVAGNFGVDAAIEERADLHVFATTKATEFHHAAQLFAEAHATRAVNAARHFGSDQRADILIDDDAFGFRITRIVFAVTEREILQLAFAAFITDRTVERMV